jgi:hypothetical protein
MWNSTNISSSFSAPPNHSLDSLLFKEIIGRRSIHVFFAISDFMELFILYLSGMLFNTKLKATEPVTTIVQWRVNFILAPKKRYTKISL